MMNGEFIAVDQTVQTVHDLLSSLKVELKCVAVELNGDILELQEFECIHLKEGDTVEIVSFVGGG